MAEGRDPGLFRVQFSMLHRHEFHLLWWHFGPHGPQNVHLHPCGKDEWCEAELVAPGWNCDGEREGHRVVSLEEAKAWAAELQEVAQARGRGI